MKYRPISRPPKLVLSEGSTGAGLSQGARSRYRVPLETVILDSLGGPEICLYTATHRRERRHSMAIACERVEQLTVILENRPGILADLCAHLSDNGINVRAMMTLEGGDTGGMRMVLDKPDEARETLTAAGVAHSTTECLAVQMPHSPGGLAEIARLLSLAGVNIDYIYGSSTAGSSTALGIFGVSDLERALEHLSR
jgi:hypothetical protein